MLGTLEGITDTYHAILATLGEDMFCLSIVCIEDGSSADSLERDASRCSTAKSPL